MTPAFRRLCAAAVATFAVHVHASEQPDQLIELTPAQTAALAIEVEQASTATVIEVDNLLGRIELPLVGTNVIASPYAGRITRIAADEGERVTAGQVLAVSADGTTIYTAEDDNALVRTITLPDAQVATIGGVRVEARALGVLDRHHHRAHVGHEGRGERRRRGCARRDRERQAQRAPLHPGDATSGATARR